MVIFPLISIKATLSDTGDGSFQKYVCTDFQKISVYLPQDKVISVTKKVFCSYTPIYRLQKQ